MTSIDINTPAYIDLDDAEKEDSTSLYVVNDASFRGVPSKLIISGREFKIMLHASWIPQNVTVSYAKKDCLNTPEFREAVVKGHIRIVSAVWAKAVEKTKAYMVESHRIAISAKPKPDEILEAESEPYTNVYVTGILDSRDPVEIKLAGLNNVRKSLTTTDVEHIRKFAREEEIKRWAAGLTV